MAHVICIDGYWPIDEDGHRVERKPDQQLTLARLYEVLAEDDGIPDASKKDYVVQDDFGKKDRFMSELFVPANVIEVELLAFDRDNERKIRLVGIPADKPVTLDKVFYYGQNDFQPCADRYSVSVGDVIRWDGKKVVVCGLGFAVMSDAQYEEYLKVESYDRTFYIMKNEGAYNKID